jgi:TolA-binding protein
MRAWIERFMGTAMAALAAIAVLLLAYLRGRSTGRSAEREQRDTQINRQADQARQEVRDVQDQTARMDDAAIADELKRDWVRGAGPGGR